MILTILQQVYLRDNNIITTSFIYELGYIPPSVYVGELYLELHQGCLTSQSNIKRQNRECENSMRALEYAVVVCMIVSRHLQSEQQEFLNKTINEIEILWKAVLLNQFHDVIRKNIIFEIFI